MPCLREVHSFAETRVLLWICRALLEIYTGSAEKCIFERGLLAGIEIGLFCGYVGLFCGYIPVALKNAFLREAYLLA